jgi:uncharacterized short protein YbdD (DUF466 family)
MLVVSREKKSNAPSSHMYRIVLLITSPSYRRYVAQLQQKDPQLCSLSQIYSDHDEEQCKNPCPISGAQFRRWNCSNCLKKVQNAGHATTLPTISRIVAPFQ